MHKIWTLHNVSHSILESTIAELIGTAHANGKAKDLGSICVLNAGRTERGTCDALKEVQAMEIVLTKGENYIRGLDRSRLRCWGKENMSGSPDLRKVLPQGLSVSLEPFSLCFERTRDIDSHFLVFGTAGNVARSRHTGMLLEEPVVREQSHAFFRSFLHLIQPLRDFLCATRTTIRFVTGGCDEIGSGYDVPKFERFSSTLERFTRKMLNAIVHEYHYCGQAP